MKETKVLVVFTGGTIGTVQADGFLSLGGEGPRRALLELFGAQKQPLYEERFGTRIMFETMCPYEILSENLNGEKLELLWQAVSRGIEKDYDGVIITTGTDSLAYVSAAMGYLFADPPVPVVMVSANYPLEDRRSNALSNFEGAVLLILEGSHKGVFCSYRNEKEHYMHIATRLLPQDNYSDQVFSVKNSFYAKLEAGKSGPEWRQKESGEEAVRGEKAASDGAKTQPLRCENLADIHISFQRPYPGMQFEFPASCDAVLLDTYHSGTLPVRESGFSEFMKRAHEKHIPVFVTGVPEGLTYETVAAYEKEGACVCPPASPAAMYLKLWLLLANGMEPQKYMKTPLGQDIVREAADID